MTSLFFTVSLSFSLLPIKNINDVSVYMIFASIQMVHN